MSPGSAPIAGRQCVTTSAALFERGLVIQGSIANHMSRGYCNCNAVSARNIPSKF